MLVHHPSFLFAFFTLLIPILIHFLNLRKPKQIYFTNVAFLKNIDRQSSRKRKLKDWWLLVVRLLFLSFLVLAFAQPYIPSSESIHSKQSQVVIYIDNSPSMQVESDGVSALTKAVNQAHQLVNSYPSDTRFQFITNDFKRFHGELLSLQQVKDLLSRVELSTYSRTLEAVKNKIDSRQDELKTPKSIYFFSDFQKNGGDLKINKNDSLPYTYHLIPVDTDAKANMYVDSVWMDYPLIGKNLSNKIHVQLHNSGDVELSAIRLTFFLEGVQSGMMQIVISPHARKTVAFDYTFSSYESAKGEIRLEGDPVTFDNRFYFSINPFPSVKILLIKDQNTDPDYIATVFHNDTFFVTRSISSSSIRYNLYKDYDLIVLNELKQIFPLAQHAFDAFLEKGGTLLIVPPQKDMDIKSYQSFFNTYGIRFYTNVDRKQRLIQSPDFQHPFFRDIIQVEKERMSMPYGVSQFECSAAGRADYLLQLEDRSPYLTYFSLRQGGRLFLLASSLHHPDVSLPAHALFVPVMYRIAFSSGAYVDYLYAELNQKYLAIPIEELNQTDVYKLTQADREWIPSQHIYGRLFQLDLSSYDLEPGYYNWVYRQKVLRKLAFNYDRSESDFSFYTSDQLKKYTDHNSNISIGNNETSGPVSLWRYCLWIALFFLTVEVVILRFYQLFFKS